MPKTKSSKKRTASSRSGARASGGRFFLALMLISAFGVGGFAAYVKLNPSAQHVPADLKTQEPSSQPSDPDDSPSVRRKTSDGPDVSITRSDPDALRVPTVSDLDHVRLGDLAPAVPDGVDPKVFIATATLNALKIDKARAIGVTVRGRNAMLDFSPELRKGYGSTEEAILVKAMQTALGQFPDIDTFQFVIDGQVQDTLGQLDFSEPIPVLRADGKAAEPVASPADPGSSTQ